MGVVYYANYFVWMEIGRVELVRSLGLDYGEIEAVDGLLLSVVESECRYLAPARYDQQIVVRTWLSSANARLIEFAYSISLASSDQLLARGRTKHVWVNREFKPVKLPQNYLHILKQKIEPVI